MGHFSPVEYLRIVIHFHLFIFLLPLQGIIFSSFLTRDLFTFKHPTINEVFSYSECSVFIVVNAWTKSFSLTSHKIDNTFELDSFRDCVMTEVIGDTKWRVKFFPFSDIIQWEPLITQRLNPCLYFLLWIKFVIS